MALLALAQVDRHGNVNVSKPFGVGGARCVAPRFGGRLAGAGGAINISQNARSGAIAARRPWKRGRGAAFLTGEWPS